MCVWNNICFELQDRQQQQKQTNGLGNKQANKQRSNYSRTKGIVKLSVDFLL